MEQINMSKTNATISMKENELLLKVLKKYSIIPEDINKFESYYKIKEKNRNYCLYKFKHSNNKALKSMKILEYLKNNGFCNIPELIMSSSGERYIRCNKNVYCLTSYIDGDVCNFEDIEQIKTATKLLADFHIKSIGFSDKEININLNKKNWLLEIKNKKLDLLNYKKNIENKKIKDNFDNLYYDYADIFCKYVDISLMLLSHSSYIIMQKDIVKNKIICHNNFYVNSLIYDSKKKLYLIDFSNCVYDIHDYDIAMFVRKILCKKSYLWKFEVCKIILGEYDNCINLSHDDYLIILAFLVLPDKFLNLGKKRYENIKRWSEDKYMKKIKKNISHVKKQETFIEDYEKYYKC